MRPASEESEVEWTHENTQEDATCAIAASTPTNGHAGDTCGGWAATAAAGVASMTVSRSGSSNGTCRIFLSVFMSPFDLRLFTCRAHVLLILNTSLRLGQ